MVLLVSRQHAGSFVLVVLLGLALCMASCGGENEGGPAVEGGVLPDQEISSFTLTQTNDGQSVWSLTAELALVFEEADRIETTRPRIEFFDDGGERLSVLTARNGLLKRRTNDMQVSGSVIVTANDGTELRTEHLTWDERRGKILTDRPVRVTRDGDVMTGTGAEADPDLGNLRILADFRAYVRSADGQLVEEE